MFQQQIESALVHLLAYAIICAYIYALPSHAEPYRPPEPSICLDKKTNGFMLPSNSVDITTEYHHYPPCAGFRVYPGNTGIEAESYGTMQAYCHTVIHA